MAKQRRAEQDLATFRQHLAEERDAASAARERSNTAAAQGLAGREELAALKAQMSSLQAELAKAKLDVKVGLLRWHPTSARDVHYVRHLRPCLGACSSSMIQSSLG